MSSNVLRDLERSKKVVTIFSASQAREREGEPAMDDASGSVQ
jgi:hypothetical protein